MSTAPAREKAATTAMPSDQAPKNHLAEVAVQGRSDSAQAAATNSSILFAASHALPVESAQRSDRYAQPT